MITTIVILLLLLGFSIYGNINLLKKNERLEDENKKYNDYIEVFSNLITQSNIQIKKLDEKGIFESDDEVGYFLRFLKHIQEELNKLNMKK